MQQAAQAFTPRVIEAATFTAREVAPNTFEIRIANRPVNWVEEATSFMEGRRPVRGIVHFIGFRGDEFTRAQKIWGKPDFIHRNWDERARQEIAPGDIAVFAQGNETSPCNPYAFNDSAVM